MAFIVAPWAQPRSVSSVLVVPPAEEPLTLDEAKLRAGLYWVSPDPRDDMMKEFIAAARQQVEQDTGLALLMQTREITVAPLAAVDVLPLPTQALPLISITDLDGNPIDPATYTVQPDTWTVRWNTPITAGVRIVSGWETAGALKQDAPLLYQAVALLTAHFATLGRDLASVGHGPSMAITPYGYDEAIGPYRLVWMA